MAIIVEPPKKSFFGKIGDILVTGFGAAGCCVEPDEAEKQPQAVAETPVEQEKNEQEKS